MSKDLMIYFDEEGVAKAYDDTYDITIHCETEEEQRKAIEQLKSLQWISCSERLPEDQRPVIVYVPPDDTYLGYVGMAYYSYSVNGGMWCGTDGNIYGAIGKIRNPSQWMPLPEPYREDEHEAV